MAATTGTNNGIIKQQNLEAVKLMLYRHAPISRAEIAAQLGLTPATITNITADLIAQGTVEELKDETPAATAARGTGRKPILLDLRADWHTVLGVSLGRDATRFSLCDMRGGVLAQGTFEVMSDDYGVMLHQLQGILSLIHQQYAALWDKLLAIGLSIPGIVNCHTGRVKNHGSERLSWRNQPLADEISRFTGLPVRIENNVRARSCAIGLFYPELLEKETSFALCHVSFGIACPFVLSNRMFRGEDAAAGEIGKMVLVPKDPTPCDFARPGSLEALASVQAMLRQCRQAFANGETTLLTEWKKDPQDWRLPDLLQAQRQNDPLVCRVLEDAMFYVGIALANIVDIINPHLVLLNGEVFTNPQNAQAVERSLLAHAFLPDDDPLRVVPVDMSEYAGSIGAVACCIEKYFLRG
ncbi:MAG: ROK family transcriptional regulator [Clostridia bacterium]|nr:ROK family transcriptional regulator [Clostridia bacterium]